MAIDAVQEALFLVDKAMLEGDRKYGENAWRDSPTIADPKERIKEHVTAIQRHLNRVRRGEAMDTDSGHPALAHVVARALIALQTCINTDLVEVGLPENNLSPTRDIVWAGRFQLFGVQVNCETLRDGQRIIEADSMRRLFDAMLDGPGSAEDQQGLTADMVAFMAWREGKYPTPPKGELLPDGSRLGWDQSA